MNAPLDNNSFVSKSVGLSDFHCARSECVDAFASLEAAVYRLAAILKIQPDNKGQFSQLIKKLKAAPAGPQLSKENAAKLKAYCDEVVSALGQRADIVHSRMLIINDSPELFAVFRNASAIGAGTSEARVYDLKMLSDVANKACQTACRFDSLRNFTHPKRVTPNLASSPPPPSPDAAVGP